MRDERGQRFIGNPVPSTQSYCKPKMALKDKIIKVKKKKKM